jgi:hypothetical protein
MEMCCPEPTASKSNLLCLKEVNVPSQENMNKIGCPFAVLSGLNCTWEGFQSDLMGHVTSSHECETKEKSEPFVVQLQNCSVHNNFHKAVLMLDKLFYLFWLIKEDIIHFLVCVIPKKTSEEFTYNIKLRKGQEQIAVTGGACGSFWNNESTVLKTGDIVRLHRRTVENFFEKNDTLSYVIHIRRKENTLSPTEVADTCHIKDEMFFEGFEMGSSEEEPDPLPFSSNEHSSTVLAR